MGKMRLVESGGALACKVGEWTYIAHKAPGGVYRLTIMGPGDEPNERDFLSLAALESAMRDVSGNLRPWVIAREWGKMD